MEPGVGNLPVKDESGKPYIHPKRQIFADEWLTGNMTGKRMNATAAYEAAGYKLPASNPSANSSKLLRHPEVQNYMRWRMEQYCMHSEEVLFRFSEIARHNVGEILKEGLNGQIEIDPKAVIRNKHMIKSFTYDTNGNPKIEFYDAFEALKQIARVEGMYKDALEVGGPGGGPLQIQVQFVMPDGSMGALPKPKEEIVGKPVFEESFEEFDE